LRGCVPNFARLCTQPREVVHVFNLARLN